MRPDEGKLRSAALAVIVIAGSLVARRARAADWYVDAAASGAHDGKSWSTAWSNVSDVGAVSPGDTIFISGGTASQTYSIAGGWNVKGGTDGMPIHYEVGQDAAHDGIVVFDAGGTWNVLRPENHVEIDGDVGGARHMQFIHGNAATSSAMTTLMTEPNGGVVDQRFRYLELNGGVVVSGATGVEFDHVKWNATNWVNRALFCQGSSALGTFTDCWLHDSEIWVVRDVGASYTGDDGFAGYNALIENNVFGTVPIAANTYIGQAQQHQDLIQGSAGYLKIVGNWFQDSDQYCVYGEFAYDGGKLLLANNVMVNCAAASVAIGPTGSNRKIADVIVANNLAVESGQFGVGDPYPMPTAAFTDTYVYNNVTINGGGFDFGTAPSDVTQSNNLDSAAGLAFVSYTEGQPTTADFHLTSGAVAAIDTGKDLSSLGSSIGAPDLDFATDKDGVARPQGKGWDIGPYELCDDGCAPAVDAGVDAGDASGTSSTSDAGDAGDAGDAARSATPSPTTPQSGCSCDAAPRRSASAWVSLLAGLLLARRRRMR